MDRKTDYQICKEIRKVIIEYQKRLPLYHTFRYQMDALFQFDEPDMVWNFKYPDDIAGKIIRLMLNNMEKLPEDLYHKLVLLYPHILYEIIFEHKNRMIILWDIIYHFKFQMIPHPKYIRRAFDLFCDDVDELKISEKIRYLGRTSNQVSKDDIFEHNKVSSCFYISHTTILLYMTIWLKKNNFKSPIFERLIYIRILKCLFY